MTPTISTGKCRLCAHLVGKAQMTNHLKSCLKRAASSAANESEIESYHLVVEAPYLPEYWLHLQASATATFGDLDDLLRRIWLECCDHMSAFRFPQKRPTRGGRSLSNFLAAREVVSMVEDEDALMEVQLGARLQTGMKFSYQYDFGSTTDLSMRVVAQLPGLPKKRPFSLLARNEPPVIPCGQCNKPATQVCAEHGHEDAGWLCGACAAEHECGEEMLMPIVNSPRAGVCGYVGPSREP